MSKTKAYLVAGIAPLLLLGGLTLSHPQSNGPTNNLTFTNGDGTDSSVTTASSFDFSNPFFQPLGSNARSCSTCHQPSNGWSIRPEDIQARFVSTGGMDPLFLPNDGTNAPNLDMSTLAARTTATTMLRARGTI